MKHHYTDRGFKHLDPIPDQYGGEVKVYESSAAMQPCIWLAVTQSKQITTGEKGEAHAHLTIKQAKALRKQIGWLLKNHYQVKS